MRLTSALLLLALAFTCQAKDTNTLSGKVVGVSDGDTLTLLDDTKTQYKIRLVGIDAPAQPHGRSHASTTSPIVMIYQ